MSGKKLLANAAAALGTMPIRAINANIGALVGFI